MMARALAAAGRGAKCKQHSGRNQDELDAQLHLDHIHYVPKRPRRDRRLRRALLPSRPAQ